MLYDISAKACHPLCRTLNISSSPKQSNACRQTLLWMTETVGRQHARNFMKTPAKFMIAMPPLIAPDVQLGGASCVAANLDKPAATRHRLTYQCNKIQPPHTACTTLPQRLT
jgi:hypothetical protein